MHVEGRWMLTSKRFLTMILHIVLPIFYTIKCLWKYQPDILYDTTGYASALVIFKLILQTAPEEARAKPVRRAWFSSMTTSAIKEAFDGLRDDD